MKRSANRRRKSRRPLLKVLGGGILIFGAIGYGALWLLDDDDFVPARKNQGKVIPASFTHEVRPLFATRCFACHATSEGTPPRLDTPEVGTLLTSWQSAEGGLGLPSDATHKDLLSLRETSLLMRWRDEGGRHEPHWAFLPLPTDLAPPPEFSAAPWARNEIDQFHLQHLSRSHSLPAPAATPLTLLRRAIIDLTGRPPELAQAEVLLAATDPEAHYELLVDQLLASPDFGETLAALWMDAAAMADFAPEDTTTTPPQLAWRNWLVDWLNANKPMNEFLRLQLAGDLARSSPPESTLATALFRAPLREAQDTLSPEEQLEENLQDRIYRLGLLYFGFPLFHPVSTAPLLDPVTETDLDILRALLVAEGETGRQAPGAPTVSLFQPDVRRELVVLRAQAHRLQALLTQNQGEEQAAFEEWLGRAEKIPLIPDLVALFSCDAPGENFSNQALGMSTSGAAPTALAAPGVHRTALVLGGGNEASFPALCPVSPHTPTTLSFWVRLLDLGDTTTVVLHCPTPGTEGAPTQAQGLFFLHHHAGVLTAGWKRDGPTQALTVTTPFPFERAREWTHLTWTNDGSGRAAGLRLHLNGQPAPLTTTADSLPVPLFTGEAAPVVRFGSAEKSSGTFLLDELHAYRRALTPVEIRHLMEQKGLFTALADPVRQHADLKDYYFSSISQNARMLRGELDQVRASLALKRTNQTEVPVMRGSPAPASLPAEPLFKELFSPSLAPTLSNRDDLARWLTRSDHPLTARVFVNRIWQHFHGEGLAPSGFGLGGAPVVDPALLDWLARDFVDHGWDLKHLCRKILLSAHYRQFRATPQALPRRTQRKILRTLCGIQPGQMSVVPGNPPEAPLVPPAPLQHDWSRPTKAGAPFLDDATLLDSARRITSRLIKKHPEDDSARMRELFLRFRCQDQTHPEFKILLNMLVLQKQSWSEKGADSPQLIIGAGIEEDPNLDPREWAAWLEICTLLLHDENLLNRR